MFCPKCGNGLNSKTELPFKAIGQNFLSASVGQKYPILRLIAIFYKVSAVIVVLFGLISSLGSCASMSAYGMFAGNMMFFGVMIFLGSIALAISLWALGEGIMVFLDMEENLRKIAGKE
jgi:hypothetical protein